MNIKEIKYSHRNDFKAIFVCPKCGLNSYGETMEQLKTRVGREYVI